MKCIGIDHMAIAAFNVEELVNWYCNVIGFKVHFSNNKPVVLLKSPNGIMLEIMPQNNHTMHQVRQLDTPGISHLAFEVTDINNAITYLDQKGILWAGNLADATGEVR